MIRNPANLHLLIYVKYVCMRMVLLIVFQSQCNQAGLDEIIVGGWDLASVFDAANASTFAFRWLALHVAGARFHPPTVKPASIGQRDASVAIGQALVTTIQPLAEASGLVTNCGNRSLAPEKLSSHQL